ncbi:MAG: hypothetical protein ABFD18_15325 [Syntrophomonas sp.]
MVLNRFLTTVRYDVVCYNCDVKNNVDINARVYDVYPVCDNGNNKIISVMTTEYLQEAGVKEGDAVTILIKAINIVVVK